MLSEDQHPPSPQPQANNPWLWSFIARQTHAVVGAQLTGVVGGITSALEPYLIGVVVDHVRQGIDVQQMRGDIALLLGLALVTVVAFFGQRIYSGQVAYAVNFDIRRTLFDNLLTLEQGFFQRYPTGDLISRMYADMDMIWRLLALGFYRFSSSMATVIMAFVLLATIHVPLTLVVFAVLAVSTTLQIRAGKVLAPVFEQVQEQAGTVSAHVQDAFSGIQTVKTFGKEAGVAEKFHQENLEYRRRWLFFRRRNEPVGMLPNMISQMTAGIVVLFGGMLTLQGTLTLGNFVQFLFYLGLISTALLNLGTIYQRYQQAKGALARLTPLLQIATIRDAQDAVPLPQPRGEIAFENVGVQAEGTWLLRNVSLHIPDGTVVALVGATGSGKTLLVNLLTRVLDPTEGRVLVDGVDVRKLKLADLRRAVAYVPQSTFLFSQTLQENVRMGRADITRAQLERAVHISRISNDLSQLPQGMETLVGEKGVMLSGGQKQRVAIARAIVRDPAILVLDDALSSVDTQTAADILAELRGVLRTRTSLIIAHRIATVKDADLIVVMAEGQIVETGTHVELIAQDGVYARMVERELIDERAEVVET